MGLAQVQQALARLYTEASLREQFFAEAEACGAALGLSPVEVAQIVEATGQIQFFAESLQRKRLNEVNRLLPLTRRALGRAFGTLFLRYAATFTPRGVRKHQADAIHFADCLAQLHLTENLAPTWSAELARYEAGWIAAWEPDCFWHTRRFQYPVRAIAQALAQGQTPAVSQRQLGWGVWFRPRPRGGVWHWFFTSPFLKR